MRRIEIIGADSPDIGAAHAEETRKRWKAIALGTLASSQLIQLCDMPDHDAEAGILALLKMLIDTENLPRFNALWGVAINAKREELKG